MFFYLQGKEAIDQKIIFSKFFIHDNVLKMMPGIQKIFFNNFKKLKDLWKDSDQNEWKSVEMTDVLGDCFNDMVHIVILGEEEPDKVPKIKGFTFSHALEHWVAELFCLMKKPLHVLTLGYSTKLNWSKQAKTNSLLYQEIIKKSKELLVRRKTMEPKKNINLIDMMHAWNSKCEKPGGDKSKILN